MNKFLFSTLLLLSVTFNGSFAQQNFMVQGHSRPDVKFPENGNSKLRSTLEEDRNFTFDDITFWVGEGEKRAALVIDWFDGKGGTLVWGYRWDGIATGYDMVSAIAKVDPRFTFLTHYTGGLGNTIAGLGYDLDQQGPGYFYFDGDSLNPHYPVNGMIYTNAYNYDSWTAADINDHWRSGWYNGYWSYQVKESQEDSFGYSGWGATSRQLIDGSWDGWGYQDGWESTEGVIPRAPYVSAPAPSAAVAFESYWPNHRKSTNNQAIVNTKSPVSADDAEIAWKYNAGLFNTIGGPLFINNNVYITVKNKIYILDKKDGTVLKEGTLASNIGYFSTLAYGDGIVFVPVASGVIQAFDAGTLESLWQTEELTNFQTLCQITYKDGYIYTGIHKNGNPTTGKFMCLSTTDEDPNQTNEIKTPVWVSEDTGGYYWSGATIVGNAVIFGGDSGILYSLDRFSGEVIDSYDTHADGDTSLKTIRCSISYDEESNAVYFTGKESKSVYKVPLNDGGSFNKAEIKETDLGAQGTTSPVIYNKRMYVTLGTMTSSGGLAVLDAESMEIIYMADLGGISQSFPLLTTAYATEENNHTVYLYAVLNNANGHLVRLKDFEGNETADVEVLYAPDPKQYSTSGVVSDEKGTLYFRNDAGTLFALRRITSIVSEETKPVGDEGNGVFNLSLKVTATEKITGSFTVSFPEGVELDQEETRLAPEFEGKVQLSFENTGNNTWKIILSKPEEVRSTKETEYTKILDVAYKVSNNVQNGTVNVTVKDVDMTSDNGSQVKEDEIEVPITVQRTPTSITQGERVELKLYPNPITDYLTVDAGEVITDIVISDINGRIVFRANGNNAGSMIIPFREQTTGLYIVKVTTENATSTHRVIKK